jgi:hypothetical protein
MQRFGIFSPIVMRKDIPHVLLSEAASPDMRNTRLYNGELVSQKMRKPLLDTCPATTKDVLSFSSTAVNIQSITLSTKTIVVSGNVTSYYTVGRKFVVAGAVEAANDTEYTVVSSSYSNPNTSIIVTAMPGTGDQGSAQGTASSNFTISVMGDATALAVGDKIQISDCGTAANNGVFTVISDTIAAGRTNIIVNEPVTTASSPVNIQSIDVSDKTVVVASDVTAIFAAGHSFIVESATDSGNDLEYVVASATFATPNTTIVTVGAPHADQAGAAGTVPVVIATIGYGSATVLHYHTFTVPSTGTEHLLAFTAHHAFLWNQTKEIWQKRYEYLTADITHWSTDVMHNMVIAANGKDFVLYWEPFYHTTYFQPLGSAAGLQITSDPKYITCARYVKVFENHLWLGWFKVGVTDYPTGTAWSDIGAPTNFLSGDAGSWGGVSNVTSPISGSDNVSGFGEVEGCMVMFREQSVHQVWIVTSDDIWNANQVSNVIGTKSPDSIVRDADGKLYFLGTDASIREVRMGSVSKALGSLVKDIDPVLAPYVRSAYIRELQEVWWAVPSSAYPNFGSGNNVILQYKPEDGTWNTCVMPVSAFGIYSNKTADDYHNGSAGTFDDWEGIYDEAQDAIGFPLDIVSDYDGENYAAHASDNDNNAACSRYFVLGTGLTAASSLGIYKRLLELRLMFANTIDGNTVNVWIKRDSNRSWELAATLETYDGDSEITLTDMSCDFRAKHFQIKIETTDPFRFLGVICGFEYDGEY